MTLIECVPNFSEGRRPAVVDEIADWNLPSIRISSLSGFQVVGKMFVETVRKKRIKKDIVRR